MAKLEAKAAGNIEAPELAAEKLTELLEAIGIAPEATGGTTTITGEDPFVEAGRIPADTLGTVVLTTFSVALAWASTHWTKRELAWLVSGLMGLGAWKLGTRDFVYERDLALVISLLFYGAALILLPRMLRKGSQLKVPDALGSPSAI